MKGTITCIEHDRIDLAYQKQINLKTGKLVGLEALLRLRDEDGNQKLSVHWQKGHESGLN